MRPRLYLETTVPSYLVARPTRDIVVAAHQQVTREWNCAHLANAELRRRVERVSGAAGIASPAICTPEELMGE